MLRISFVSVVAASAAACVAPDAAPSMQTSAVLQGEPIVAYVDIGGVT